MKLSANTPVVTLPAKRAFDHTPATPDARLGEWPWTITRTANEIKMFCPGRVNPDKGKHEDKQIILSSDPSQPGKATLRIMMDGDWLAPVSGRLVPQAGGAVFQGDGGETVSMQANRRGFGLELDGFDRICPDLDGLAIQMDRRG